MSAESAAALALDGFAIEAVLGRGASGVVYRAHQHTPARPVAIKMLPGVCSAPGALSRFEREIQLLGQIEHANVARLYSAGVHHTAGFDYPYLVMECVEGVDIATYAHTQKLGVHDAMRLLAILARAVHQVHTQGVVHRDLKPGNVLVCADGIPKILDFGVARALQPEDDGAWLHTRAGDAVGTLPYMAPEQLLGESTAIDARTDIYALGVIGYQMLAGRLPFHPEAFRTLITAAEAKRHAAPELQCRQLGVAPDLASVLAKAMQGDRAQRYGSALEFALDLERFLDQRPVLARSRSAFADFRLWLRRHRVLALGSGLGLISLLVALGFAMQALHQERLALAQATRSATQSASALHFLQESLTAPEVLQSRGANASIRVVLDAAERRLRAGEPDDPVAHIMAGLLIATAMDNLLDSSNSAQLFARIAEEADRRSGLAPDLQARVRLGAAIGADLQARHQAAEQMVRSLLPVGPGTDKASHVFWVDVRNLLADVLVQEGRPQEALPFLLQAEQGLQRWPELEVGNLANYTLQRRLSVEFNLGHFAVVLDMQRRRGEQLQQRFGLDTPGVQNLLNTAGMSARELGAFDDAVTFTRRFADSAVRTYGAHSAASLEAEAKLAYVQFLQHPARSGPATRLEQLQRELQALHLDDPAYELGARINLAAVRLRSIRQRTVVQGIRTLQTLDAEVASHRLPNSTQTMRARLMLAETLARQHDAGADAIYARLCTDLRATLPDSHPYRLRCEAGSLGHLPGTLQN